MKTNIKTYSELLTFSSYEDRLKYLMLNSKIGIETFGFDRWINQSFYKSRDWLRVKEQIIIRDNGCDMGLEGFEIYDRIIVHHMNPLDSDDIRNVSDYLLNPNYLISVSLNTHNAIHYGRTPFNPVMIERTMNDTCPWRTR